MVAEGAARLFIDVERRTKIRVLKPYVAPEGLRIFGDVRPKGDGDEQP
jgi:hypothetical protein